MTIITSGKRSNKGGGAWIHGRGERGKSEEKIKKVTSITSLAGKKNSELSH